MYVALQATYMLVMYRVTGLCKVYNTWSLSKTRSTSWLDEHQTPRLPYVVLWLNTSNWLLEVQHKPWLKIWASDCFITRFSWWHVHGRCVIQQNSARPRKLDLAAGPISESNFFLWETLIAGPQDTPFVSRLVLSLSIQSYHFIP